MEPVRRLKYVADPTKFDLRTHVWDSQGHLVSKNLYRRFILDNKQYYERPVNSGNLWYENNQPAGRVEIVFGPTGKISSKTFNFEAPHMEYTVPLNGAEKVHFELEQSRARNAQLEAELAAIHKDSSAKAETAAPKVTATAPTLTKAGKA